MNQGRIAMQGTVSEVYSHGDELLNMGLDVPQITEVFLKLKAKGVDCRTDIFTVLQAEQELKRLMGGVCRDK